MNGLFDLISEDILKTRPAKQLLTIQIVRLTTELIGLSFIVVEFITLRYEERYEYDINLLT